MWRRYRFKTKSVDDYRPLVFDKHYPYWCSGFINEHAVIIVYLPENENLYKYWDDAFDVEWELFKEINFTSRFPKPDWFLES